MPAEEWRPVVGYEDRYEVSSLGRVRSLDRTVHLYNGGSYIRKGAMMHPTRDTYGHLQVRLCGGRGNARMKQVHRLVADAFLGPRPKGAHTRHLNGVPTDNAVENLAYGSGRENQIDCYRYGSKSSAGKLSISQVIEIRRRVQAGESYRSVARDFGVNKSNVQRILTGEHFGWLPEEGGVF